MYFSSPPPVRATCPTNLILFDLINRIFCDENKSRSSPCLTNLPQHLKLQFKQAAVTRTQAEHLAVPSEPRAESRRKHSPQRYGMSTLIPILRNFKRDILAREIDIYRRMEQVDKQTSLRLPPYLGYPAGSRLQCVIYGSRKQSEDGHLRIAFERLPTGRTTNSTPLFHSNNN